MTMSAEHGSIAEVGSPVDVPADPIDGTRPLAWASMTISVATALLTLFNAHAIGGWFDDLSPSPVTAPLAAPITGWTGVTGRAGLDGPRAALHGRWEKVRGARFGAEQPGEDAGGTGD